MEGTKLSEWMEENGELTIELQNRMERQLPQEHNITYYWLKTEEKKRKCTHDMWWIKLALLLASKENS